MPFLDIVIIAIVAGVILYRLYNVLGQTSGDEMRPRPGMKDATAAQDSITEFYKEKAREIIEEMREDETFPDNPDLTKAVKEIRKADPRFNMKEFLKGAEAAFEMVLDAYTQDDRATLKQLLDTDLYRDFAKALDERKKSEEREETTLISIVSAEPVRAELIRRLIRVTVAFTSTQISVVRNAEGEIIEGDPSHEVTVEDIWEFERYAHSTDPNWKLVATHSKE